METATWAVAIATFLAVIVALFKEEMVRLWHRPKLSGSCLLVAPHCHKTELTYHDPATRQLIARGDCYYLRIWIENQGYQRAEKVQVFASKLMRKHADGVFREDKDFLPMNLRWSHSREVFAEGISPKMGRHCDLAYIEEPLLRAKGGRTLTGVAPDKTILALDLEVKPNTLSVLLAPGTYRLELKIAAANAPPKEKHIEINLTGDWFPDERKMFSDGVGIKELD